MATAPSQDATLTADTSYALYVLLVDQLLALVGRTALDAGELPVEEFRATLEGHRNDLAEAETEAEVEAAASSCLAVCERHFRHARAYLAGCEEELADTLALLRSAVETLSGESRDFDDELKGSTQRLSRLAQLNDIRELKHEIKREVARIETTVSERRELEEAQLATLTNKVEALEQSLIEARDEASRDALTGIANRRAFDHALKRAMARAELDDSGLVVALVDIDNFKRINDLHGHLVGDRVIVCLAQLLSSGLRKTDLVARFGGEEFALLLQGLTLEQANKRLQQIRDGLASSYEYESEGKVVRVRFTYSCGVTALGRGETAEALVKRADEALYAAKKGGKDRIVTRKRSRLGALFARAATA